MSPQERRNRPDANQGGSNDSSCVTSVLDALTEAPLLGALMSLSVDEVTRILPALMESDFVDPRHREVFKFIVRSNKHGREADPSSLLHLARTGGGLTPQQLNVFGDTVLTIFLSTTVPQSAGWYVAAVVEAALRRRAKETATRLIQVADSGSTDAVIDTITSEWQALAEQIRRLDRRVS